ncbi:MAG: glutamate racemase [Burkholderiales bacterium]|nr:glutamate racemase [Burkholderiales bacterium]
MQAPIGVFDSGVGGLSILRALRAELPAENFVYFADSGHAPYGERGDAYVIARTHAVARQLLDEHRIKALVVACNTATAAAIHLLRAEYPGLPVVGVEPALKPAIALSRTGRIGVMATRGTLASAKFAALHDSLKGQADFVLQPCDGLADAIQNDDATKIVALCAQYMRSLGTFGSENGQIDTLVLGCTHYPFASHHLQPLAGPLVRLVETGEPVARQARRLLEAAGLAKPQGEGGTGWETTGDAAALAAAAGRWLQL